MAAPVPGSELGTWFWQEKFWLPENVSWSDLRPSTSRPGPFPDVGDLLLPPTLAIVLLTLRYLHHRFVGLKIARYFKLSASKPNPPPHNSTLESCYAKNLRLDAKATKVLANDLAWTESQVSLWFRSRRRAARTTVAAKFNDSCWKFIYYLSAFTFGVTTLRSKPWWTDSGECWYGYPNHVLDWETYTYYMLALSWYWSLLLAVQSEKHRKDFWQMFAHHITTLLLLHFSYITNMVRIGSLVLVIHDACDWLLEGAKMANYCRLQHTSEVFFVVFTVTWFITRLCIFPYRILGSTLWQAVDIIGMYGSYAIFNFLLISLQVMHVIWFGLILRVAKKSITTGKVQKDERSSSSSGEDDDAKTKMDDFGKASNTNYMKNLKNSAKIS